MRVTLSSGPMFVGIQHIKPSMNGVEPGTKAWLEKPKDQGGEVVAVGRSLCKGTDQFNRFIGRQRAAASLLRKMKSMGYSSEDRGKVFSTICPEFGKL